MEVTEATPAPGNEAGLLSDTRSMCPAAVLGQNDRWPRRKGHSLSAIVYLVKATGGTPCTAWWMSGLWGPRPRGNWTLFWSLKMER